MAVDPIRRKLYVANSRSGNVSVINLTAERWKKTIQTGNKPHAIALIEE
jgi:YVTN family beta-propeller protein